MEIKVVYVVELYSLLINYHKKKDLKNYFK